MLGRARLRSAAGLLASTGVFALTSIVHSVDARADVGILGTPGLDVAEVIGPSGVPIPGSSYVQEADNLYLSAHDLDLTFPGATAVGDCATVLAACGDGLYTPESFYPNTGPQSLYVNYPLAPFSGYIVDDGVVASTPTTLTNGDGSPLEEPSDTSSAGQGLAILNNAILSNYAHGDTTTVFGNSQSSTIAGYEMQVLQAESTPEMFSDGRPTVSFLLVGDPSNPNGGLLERFNGFETVNGQTTVDPLQLPSIGVDFTGATPSDLYPADIYTIEYDGFADFPRYPINFLADLNAIAGIVFYHGQYLEGSSDVDGALTTTSPSPYVNLAPVGQDANAYSPGTILLPGSALDGNTDSLTNYYMILENHLPLLYPFFGPGSTPAENALGDLIEPDLKVLVNLGYGADDLGYSDTPADVATPFGLFPDVNATTVLDELLTAAQQGVSAFDTDVANGAFEFAGSTSASDVSDPLTAQLPSLTELANALSSAASAAYGALLPAADFVNAITTSLPAYDATVFADNLVSGDLLDAIGLPLAADVGTLTSAAGIEAESLLGAAESILHALQGLT